jgi:hypothetical protein
MRISLNGFQALAISGAVGYRQSTPNRSRKTRLDFSLLAKRIVEEATGATEKTPPPNEGKDPLAVEFGAGVD